MKMKNKSNNKNEEYEKQIKELKKQLLDANDKIKLLIEDNKQLKEIVKQLKQEKKEIKKQSEIEINKLKEKIKIFDNQITNKNIEIQKKIKNKHLNNNKNQTTSSQTEEENLLIMFKTQDNKDIHNYEMTCKNNDLFVRLEEKLYNDFPEYKNYETSFKTDNKRILRFKTIEENKIKNNEIISLFINN